VLLLALAIFAFVHLNESAQANFYMWSVTVVSNLNTAVPVHVPRYKTSCYKTTFIRPGNSALGVKTKLA